MGDHGCDFFGELLAQSGCDAFPCGIFSGGGGCVAVGRADSRKGQSVSSAMVDWQQPEERIRAKDAAEIAIDAPLVNACRRVCVSGVAFLLAILNGGHRREGQVHLEAQEDSDDQS